MLMINDKSIINAMAGGKKIVYYHCTLNNYLRRTQDPKTFVLNPYLVRL